MTFWQSRHRGAPGAQASSLRSADTYSISNDATVLHKATKQSHLLSVNKPNFNISWSADLITTVSSIQKNHGVLLIVCYIAQRTAISFIFNHTHIFLKTPY